MFRVQIRTLMAPHNTSLPTFPHQAEFWVVPDRIKNRESFRALEVQILPPGTLVLEEETHKKLRGTVERAPTLPQRQGFREGTLRLSYLQRFCCLLGSLFPCAVAWCGTTTGCKWHYTANQVPKNGQENQRALIMHDLEPELNCGTAADLPAFRPVPRDEPQRIRHSRNTRRNRTSCTAA